MEFDLIKKCSRCNEIKNDKYFRNIKRNKDGLSCWCLECEKEYKKQYYKKNKKEILKKQKFYTEKNKEKIKQQSKNSYEKNKKKILEQQKLYVEKNKEKIKKYQKEYRLKNKDKIKKQADEYRLKNKDKVKKQKKKERIKNDEAYKKRSKKHYKENTDKIKKRVKKWREDNRDRVAKWREDNRNRLRELASNRYHDTVKNDIVLKLQMNLRSRLTQAIKKNFKTGSAVRDLGCSIEEFKAYFEGKFQTGMTWENWGKYGWHIDHIIPLSSFDLTNREELKKACHYTNLQPLWAKDNLKKGNKIDHASNFES